jgi:transposase
MQPVGGSIRQEETRYTRSQTYAADLTDDQKTAFDLCRAGATWFYNEACRSQLDRYRRRVPVEAFQGLSYAVSAARRGGCDFPYRGGTRLVSEVPVVFLHGALRQLSASWTRHLKMTREGQPSGPPGFRSMRRGGSLYWQVQDGGGPCPAGKLITVTRAGNRDRAARAVLRVPGSMGRVTIRYHRELPADAMIRFAALRVDDLGRYWVTVQYDTAQVRQPASSGVVGVDVGVAVTAATSDGEVYDAPLLSPGQQQRKARLQRAMARKRRLNSCRHDKLITVRGRTRLVRGHCPPPGHPDHDYCQCWKHSRRYARDKAAFLKLSQRAKRQRTAASHLASRALADKYAIVVVENLDVSAMTATAKGSEQAPGRNVRGEGRAEPGDPGQQLVPTASVHYLQNPGRPRASAPDVTGMPTVRNDRSREPTRAGPVPVCFLRLDRPRRYRGSTEHHGPALGPNRRSAVGGSAGDMPTRRGAARERTPQPNTGTARAGQSDHPPPNGEPYPAGMGKDRHSQTSATPHVETAEDRKTDNGC